MFRIFVNIQGGFKSKDEVFAANKHALVVKLKSLNGFIGNAKFEITV